MGMLDFVVDMGRKLFSDQDDPAEAIKKHIEADNPGIDELGVEFVKGFVTLTGKGRSVDAVEKAILMAGNVKGVGKVVSSIEVVESGTAGELRRAEGEGIEYYTIKSGDTLSAIAKHFYGDASKYHRLFEANREVIQNPDKIFVGQVIRIPLA